MREPLPSPAIDPPFGQADLSNCEREQIHLPGSIQPHGLLLTVERAGPSRRVITRVSANALSLLGVPAAELLGAPLARLGGQLDGWLDRSEPELTEHDALAFEAELSVPAAPGTRRFCGLAHRSPNGEIVLELEPPVAEAAPIDVEAALLAAMPNLANAVNLAALADAVVDVLRTITGYDRVMVYRFDPEGHGKIIAEARDARLESLLGHHYPASDIPQRARELYLRNRLRLLVDVHYEPAPLLKLRPTMPELDMSQCALRSMSPLHLQYLKNMGVTATAVASLVREGQLWGLIAAHHYRPYRLDSRQRAALELVAELTSTRIAALENYAHTQVAVLARQLELRLIEAASVEGDWRQALLRDPATLLEPFEASGAVLAFDGRLQTVGDTPPIASLATLQHWIDAQAFDHGVYACSHLSRLHPPFAAFEACASGVLATRLSAERADMLIWLRKEQLQSVVWAGDPHKPVSFDDPLELSPRRSFAAWSEQVRGTSVAWSQADIALARAYGRALSEFILQVHAVRLLVAEQQSAQMRRAVESAEAAVAIADGAGLLLHVNPALQRLLGSGVEDGAVGRRFEDLAARFDERGEVEQAFQRLRLGAAPHWHAELHLHGGDGKPVPVAVRAEWVNGRDGAALGSIWTFVDLRDARRTQAARAHLEQSIERAGRDIGREQPGPQASGEKLLGAILTNASLAAMDIADGAKGPDIAPLLEELEHSTERAAALFRRLRGNRR
jgi:PAS domain S-box-containing protein